MEESQLDYAAQASMELIEFLATCPIDEQEALLLQHVQKLTDDASITPIFDPDEKADWISGPKGHTLATYCSGHIALLDFFTYCCINCQHVLPDLYDLEQLYTPQDGLVVVGVHSAKFEAERLPSNVLHAVKRLNIKHPVLNDPEASLWGRLGIHCWPTLVLLNPEGKPILVLAGEGHRDILFRTVAVALTYFKEKETLKTSTNKGILTEMIEKPDVNSLKFPGKVTLNPFCDQTKGVPWLTISDSGNNRLVLVDYFQNVVHIIGGMEAEFKDGNFEEARFNNPQGVCWLKSNIFFVCDTGNHVIRRVLLDSKKVEIFAGTGVQAEFGDQGGLKYCQQSLASPWDIILYKTADMDMSIRMNEDESTTNSEETESTRKVLLVACAGSHQIWAIFLDTTVWWKYKTYAEGSVLAIVGSGREENRNNRYPNSASLAQPSGLALKNGAVYIADSESSSIRHLDLSSGQVSPLAGADRNPSNLFAYGDLDGKGYSARLQHPLGVTCCQDTDKVYVADTYNHKIKAIDTTNNDCLTVYPTSKSTITLSEPGGLCMSKTQNLIIADTNNHRIVLFDVNSKEAKILQIKFVSDSVKVEKKESYTKNNLITCTGLIDVSDSDKGKLIFIIDCDTVRGEKELHLTPEAPQRWLVRILDSSLEKDLTNEWEIIGGIRNGKEIPTKVELRKKPGSKCTDVKRVLRVEFFISLCEGGLCFIKRFAVDTKLTLSSSVADEKTHNLTVMVTPEGDINATIT